MDKYLQWFFVAIKCGNVRTMTNSLLTKLWMRSVNDIQIKDIKPLKLRIHVSIEL